MSRPSTVSQLNAVRHHAVTGPSASVLRDFYAYFGFTELIVEESPDPEYIQALTGEAWQAALILKLKNSDGEILEIIEPSASSDGHISGGAGNWSHLAFTVNSCDDAVKDVLGMGGLLVGGPITNPEAPFRVAYVRDPADNLIEIVQPL